MVDGRWSMVDGLSITPTAAQAMDYGLWTMDYN